MQQLMDFLFCSNCPSSTKVKWMVSQRPDDGTFSECASVTVIEQRTYALCFGRVTMWRPQNKPLWKSNPVSNPNNLSCSHRGQRESFLLWGWQKTTQIFPKCPCCLQALIRLWMTFLCSTCSERFLCCWNRNRNEMFAFFFFVATKKKKEIVAAFRGLFGSQTWKESIEPFLLLQLSPIQFWKWCWMVKNTKVSCTEKIRRKPLWPAQSKVSPVQFTFHQCCFVKQHLEWNEKEISTKLSSSWLELFKISSYQQLVAQRKRQVEPFEKIYENMLVAFAYRLQCAACFDAHDAAIRGRSSHPACDAKCDRVGRMPAQRCGAVHRTESGGRRRDGLQVWSQLWWHQKRIQMWHHV